MTNKKMLVFLSFRTQAAGVRNLRGGISVSSELRKGILAREGGQKGGLSFLHVKGPNQPVERPHAGTIARRRESEEEKR